VSGAIMLFTILGPMYAWLRGEMDPAWFMAISMVIALPIILVLWVQVFSRLLKFEYIGRDVN
jgi:hypothetical protein